MTLHLNSGDMLPPVDCPLLIEVSGVLVQARRTGYVTRRLDMLEYRLGNGTLLTGRFRWTYP